MTEGYGRLSELITEAYELRDAVGARGSDEGVAELHSGLLRARGSVDRLERIVADLTRIRARAQEEAEVARESMEDAVDKHVASVKTVGFGNDYSTSREREAGWRLATIEERGKSARAQRNLRNVETALDVCRLLHRGADSSRRDYEVLIRLMSVQTSLER